MIGTMPQLSRELLAKELESVERDIQAVEDQIANDPPDTSGELLRLREIQRTYRGIAASIKNAIAFDELSKERKEQ
jgi:HPt (histidine-containing phosphotransfer) domain-containing protein